MPFNNEVKAFIKNEYQSKMQLSEDSDRNFKDKLQKRKTGHVIKKDLANTKHRPKALD